jgi:molecular chaperone DnaJ
VVETPVSLTEEQKALLRELDESIRTGGEKHNPRSIGWVETVKRFFEKISP